jgi:hypothetical protein
MSDCLNTGFRGDMGEVTHCASGKNARLGVRFLLDTWLTPPPRDASPAVATRAPTANT